MSAIACSRPDWGEKRYTVRGMIAQSEMMAAGPMNKKRPKLVDRKNRSVRTGVKTLAVIAALGAVILRNSN